MTVAAPIAALAGIAAAGGIVDLVATRRPRAGGRRAGGALRTVVARVARRAPGRRAPSGLAARIDSAGLRAGTGELMSIKATAAPAALLAALIAAPAAPGRLGTALVILAPALGYAAPDLWLRRRAHARARAIEAEQADVLDLLRVALAAGLSPWRALAEVGRRHPGTLAAELAAAARRVALGLPHADALARLERRCPASGTRALVGALRRADRLGSPPGPALAAVAAEARARQARRAAEHAARAAPKIQLVVALLLVPSVLLLVAAALVPALTGHGA
jgi:tight adherence protein C